jgi:hypothetical protein
MAQRCVGLLFDKLVNSLLHEYAFSFSQRHLALIPMTYNFSVIGSTKYKFVRSPRIQLEDNFNISRFQSIYIIMCK